MKSIFLMFMIFVDSNGYESVETASDMQFSSAVSCQAELEHYANTKNVYYFCGDADLYVNQKQVFF